MAATTPQKRKATKKPTSPRTAARGRSESNGYPSAPSIIELEGEGDSPLNPPEEFIDKTPKIDHPYGDQPVYVFKPAGGGDPIVFPKISTLPVTAKFMWKIYDLAEIFQSFEWMKLGNIPRAIQEQVIDLPLGERQRFWSGWFNDATQPLDMSREAMGPPGES